MDELDEGHLVETQAKHQGQVLQEEASGSGPERLNVEVGWQCAVVLQCDSAAIQSPHPLLLREFGGLEFVVEKAEVVHELNPFLPGIEML